MLHLIVGPSSIVGLGLFTVYPIKEGDVIGVFQSRPVENSSEADGPFGLRMDDGSEVFMLCNFKFINHSSKPNVQLWDDGRVTALEDILEGGTELVSHYGKEWLDTCGHEVVV